MTRRGRIEKDMDRSIAATLLARDFEDEMRALWAIADAIEDYHGHIPAPIGDAYKAYIAGRQSG